MAFQEPRMSLHKHPRLIQSGRALSIPRGHDGLRVEEAAQAAGVSARTAYRWLKRYREEGESGLVGRPSRPHASSHLTPSAGQLIELRQAHKALSADTTGPRAGFTYLGIYPISNIDISIRLPLKATGVIRSTLRRSRPAWLKPPRGSLLHTAIVLMCRTSCMVMFATSRSEWLQGVVAHPQSHSG